MSRRICHAIEVDAPPATVWGTLTDLASFPSWNPFMIRAHGELRVGARLAVTIQPPGRQPISIRPKLLAVEPERELRWLGRFLIPGLFDGEHSFRLEAADGGTRLTQSERFSGLLVTPFMRMLERTEAGFQQMNIALKTRVEQGHSDPRDIA